MAGLYMNFYDFNDACDFNVNHESGFIDINHVLCEEISVNVQGAIHRNSHVETIPNVISSQNTLNIDVNCMTVSNNVNRNFQLENAESHIVTDSINANDAEANTPCQVDNPHDDLAKFSKNNSKNMIFSHLNINSISSKFIEIHQILVNGHTDLLFLSETKLDDSYPSAQFHVNQFSVHRHDRNAHGGGLMCYVRETIPHRNRTDIAINEDGIETIVIQVKTADKNMFFLHVYKPPDINIRYLTQNLERMLNKCFNESNHVHIIGDLNVNFKQTPNPLSQICDTYDLKQLIKSPTCFKSLNNPSLIDVILTNKSKSIKSTINLSLGISDFHNYISAATRLSCPSSEPKLVHYRSFKNFNEESYRKDLQMVPFHVSHIFDDVDDQLWFHNSLLLDIIDKNAPKKQKQITYKPLPYMNDNLRKAINVKAALRRKFLKTKSNESWQKFKKQRNLVNKLKKVSIKKYFEKNCSDSSSKGKHFWEIVKPFMTNNAKTNNHKITLFENNALISQPSDVSNTFNEYFINVTQDLSEPEIVGQMSVDEVVDHYKDHPSIKLINEHKNNDQPLFYFTEINQKAIQNKLKMLKSKKATGFDHISPKFLKIGSEHLSLSLTKIMNKCVETGIYPDNAKRAVVTPLYKKSDQLAKENYRPVSILSSTSKLFEGVMCDQLINYMSPSLSNDLSAYRKLFSCNNVLVKCIEKWRKALDNNQNVGCVLIDLSKAFDSLPHGLLIAKLYAYGVSRESCLLIMNYLKNRKQAVKLGNIRSEWLDLKTGVPQGSLMGPLLFNIFINDFIYNLKNVCDVYNYADDNTLSYSNKDLNVVKSQLEKASEQATKWFKYNYMKANPSKFQSICFSRDDTQTDFCVENNVIKSNSTVKLLGIHIDRKLKFTDHTSIICKKAARQINALQRICKYVNYKGRLRIYESFVASNFIYCSIAFNTFTIGQNKKIEKLNERALRLVCNDYVKTYSELLNRTGKKMLHEMLRINTVEFVYKVINNLAPPIESSFFSKQVCPYNMRDNNKLILPQYKTAQYGKHSIAYQGPSLWNSLPAYMKCLEDINIFKSTLRNSNCLCHCECGTCMLCLRNNL